MYFSNAAQSRRYSFFKSEFPRLVVTFITYVLYRCFNNMSCKYLKIHYRFRIYGKLVSQGNYELTIYKFTICVGVGAFYRDRGYMYSQNACIMILLFLKNIFIIYNFFTSRLTFIILNKYVYETFCATFVFYISSRRRL